MKKSLIWYGISLAFLVGLMKFLEYRFLVRDLSIEVYLGTIAILCTALGSWMGLKIIRKQQRPEAQLLDQSGEISSDLLKELHISNREYEVLLLIAKGLSNQEIADQLFVSINTIKTHSSNLFVKLDVKRRTQAIQKAKDLNII